MTFELIALVIFYGFVVGIFMVIGYIFGGKLGAFVLGSFGLYKFVSGLTKKEEAEMPK